MVTKKIKNIIFVILYLFYITPYSFAINLKNPTMICEIFPDISFSEIMARHLEKQSIYELVSQKDLNKIKILSQIGTKKISKKIENIQGIEYLNNLEILTIGGNQIVDLSPIKNLKYLREISFPFNKIMDLNPLSGLISLQRINLSYNCITNLEPLKNLHRLQVLDIRDNDITDLLPISKLKDLQTLNIINNSIIKFWPLLCLEKLADLWLYPRQIEGIRLI